MTFLARYVSNGLEPERYMDEGKDLRTVIFGAPYIAPKYDHIRAGEIVPAGDCDAMSPNDRST